MIKECLECTALFEVTEDFQPCPNCGATDYLERFNYNKTCEIEDDIKYLEEVLSEYPNGSYEQEQVYKEIEHLENILIRLDKWGISWWEWIF